MNRTSAAVVQSAEQSSGQKPEGRKLSVSSCSSSLCLIVFFGLWAALSLWLGHMLSGTWAADVRDPDDWSGRLFPAAGYGLLWLAAVGGGGWLLRRDQRRSAKLATILTRERGERAELQTQLAEHIEQRTMELQRVNAALNREVAERIQAEEELRELQKQQELILDSAGEGILGLDNQGRVTFINTAASLMLGWEPEELLGNRHHALIHHSHRDGRPYEATDCPICMAYRDGQVHYKSGDVFWCKNGTSFPVEYVSTPIRDRGLLGGAVVVFRDMNTFS